MNLFINLAGLRFGRLTVVSRGKNRNGASQWNCVCDCGKQTLTASYSLRKGFSKSCGCLHKEIIKNIHTTHGKSRTKDPTYRTWLDMRYRCEKTSHEKFKMYGGSGISVCDRWRDFASFLEDMGQRPEGHTIDRINGALGYSPDNCRWATIKQQQRNIKSNRNITIDGVTKCVSEWAEVHGMHKNTITGRLNRGVVGCNLFLPPKNKKC